MEFDFGNLLNMAGNISGTINNALSLFSELTRLAKAGKLPQDVADNILALSAELSEAQVKLARLESEIVALQRHQEAHDEIKRRKRNYVLSETPMGARIYRLRDDADTDELPHEACPNCFERDLIIVLQRRGHLLRCTSCEETYRVSKIPWPSQRLHRT